MYGLGVNKLGATNKVELNDIEALFANSEQGAWYDPSDLSSLFVNSDGTGAVTVGDSVGYIKDKSGNGNHQIQATASKQAKAARHPLGGTRTLIPYSEARVGDGWVTSAATATNRTDSELGYQRRVTIASGGEPYSRFQGNTGLGVSVTSGETYTVTWYYKAGTSGKARFDFRYSTAHTTIEGDIGSLAAQSGTGGTVTLVSDTVVSGTLRKLVATWVPAATDTEVRLGIGPFTTTSGDTVIGYGVQLEEGSSATAFQLSNTLYDVTEEGVDNLYYLDFDGIDDGYQTASTVDFTGTDTMSVFSGATKEVDASEIIVELSSNVGSNTGVFKLGPISGDVWRWTTRGNLTVNSNASGYTPPVTSVLTGLSDSANDYSAIRVDGVEKQVKTNNQGTVGYGDYELNVGAKNNAFSSFLEGRIYSLIVRGVLSNDSEVSTAELYVASKTGVTLS